MSNGFLKIPDPTTLFNASMTSSQICYGKSHLQADFFYDQTAFDHQLTNHYWSHSQTMPTTMSIHDSRRTWIYMLMVAVQKLHWPIYDALMVLETFKFPCPAPQMDYENHVDKYQLLMTADFDESTVPPPMLNYGFGVPQIRPAGVKAKVLPNGEKVQVKNPKKFSSVYQVLVENVKFFTPLFQPNQATKPIVDAMQVDGEEPITARIFVPSETFKALNFGGMTPQKRTAAMKVFLHNDYVFDGAEAKKLADQYPRSKVAQSLASKAQELIEDPFNPNDAIYEAVMTDV
jgi:hypothetical protein